MKIIFLLLGIAVSAEASALPDLTIATEGITSDCRGFIVVVRNKGDGVPLSAYNDTRNSIRVSFDGVITNHFGSKPSDRENFYSLGEFDPGKALAKKGGRASKTIVFDMEGATRVSTYVDMPNSVQEGNEKNNFHNKAFTCSNRPTPPGLPDIKLIEVKVLPNCNILTRLKNVGPGYLANSAWVKSNNSMRIYFRAAWDGQNQKNLFLSELDPQKKLKHPGGEIQYIFDWTKFKSDYRTGKQVEFKFSTVMNRQPGKDYPGSYKFTYNHFLECKKENVPARRGKPVKPGTFVSPVIKMEQKKTTVPTGASGTQRQH